MPDSGVRYIFYFLLSLPLQLNSWLTSLFARTHPPIRPEQGLQEHLAGLGRCSILRLAWEAAVFNPRCISSGHYILWKPAIYFGTRSLKAL